MCNKPKNYGQPPLQDRLNSLYKERDDALCEELTETEVENLEKYYEKRIKKLLDMDE